MFRVTGNSMKPTFSPGDRVLVINHRFSAIVLGSVIVFYHYPTKRYFLKRVKEIKRNKYFVLGDNTYESTDSRTFGWIEKKEIIGRVIYPKTV